MEKRVFKIIILGDGNVGKTSFVRKHLGFNFKRIYEPTLGVEIYPLKLNTNYGSLTFNVWDCAGVEKFGGLRERYYVASNGAILMFDVTNEASHVHLSKWTSELPKGIPITICGNKCDSKERIVFHGDVEIPSQVNVEAFGDPYCDISVAKGQNLEKPFLFLARRLTKKKDLNFVRT